MKKIYSLGLMALLLLLPVGFGSCSDDDEGTGSASMLVGTWETVYQFLQEKENGIVVDEEENTERVRVTFNEDGTYDSAEYYNGEWDWNFEGTWSYTNGKLTVIEDGDSFLLTVKTLTASKLVTEETARETYNGNTYEYYALTEFRKISN
ncbi:MAG: lipocalin family protein [Prevotellaceae bacterium]|jgi:hypothetical protein|nr:lipocalin family protein [Prevotellaceae bacterium]MDR0989343.1 lipocalin family protein [Prevotellaceae bacterium]